MRKETFNLNIHFQKKTALSLFYANILQDETMETMSKAFRKQILFNCFTCYTQKNVYEHNEFLATVGKTPSEKLKNLQKVNRSKIMLHKQIKNL